MENTVGLIDLRNTLDQYIDDQSFSMMFYRNRLKTFKNWPYSHQSHSKCTPNLMAQAGFYLVSKRHEDTSVKCFSCLKELDGWESQDNPWEEHKKHQPNCPYIILNKTEREWTVDNFVDLFQSMTIELQKIKFSDAIDSLQDILKIKQNTLRKEQGKSKRRK